MKKLSLLICLCALVMTSFAQLPDESYAPAFTGYEINKTNGTIITNPPIVLHDLTDAGKVVYMDVFATWCNPCWSYHTSGALESLYAQYGPNGTDEVRVLAIEGSNGNYNSLSGAGADAGGSATQGNWLNGVEYPVIPLKMSPNTTAFDNDYAIAYFPTVYMVCPNRLVYEVGQQTAANLYASKSSCPDFNDNLANNALLLSIHGIEKSYYCEFTATPTVSLQNLGSNNLTTATITIEFEGETTTYNWTGNLAKYETSSITLPQISSNTDGEHTYTLTVATVNGEADADPVWNTSSYSFNVAVNPTSSALSEDFSNDIPSDWGNPDELLFTYDVGGNHGNAVIFYAYQFSSGTTSNLYLPYENLSVLNNPVMIFDLAHRRYNTSTSERLRVMYSTDCGSSWSSAFNKSGAALATVSSPTTNAYIPNESDWREEIVNLADITDNDDVIIRFEFKSGYGNDVWIDNVKIMNGTGIITVDENLSIYPNPATDVIRINSSYDVQRIEIFNMQGQLVKMEFGNVDNISVKDLANGMYTLKLTTDNGTTMHKIVKK